MERHLFASQVESHKQKAGCCQEEMITAELDLSSADRSYALDSLKNPSFVKKYWVKLIEEMKDRTDQKPE